MQINRSISIFDRMTPLRRSGWLIMTVYTIVIILFCFGIYEAARRCVVSSAEKEIHNMLLQYRGVHSYIQNNIIPELHSSKEAGEISKAFYSPVLFSSSYMVRNIHSYLNNEREKAGLSQFYYKLAAANPRNPVNKADIKEQQILHMFNKNRNLTEYLEVITIDGQQYLQLATPFLTTGESCLNCHGRRKDAPSQLQARYNGAGGFNETVGSISAIESLRVPLDKQLNMANIAVIAFASIAFGFIMMMGFSSRLRAMVATQTGRLQESEERFRILHDASFGGICIHDKGVILDCNQGLADITGFTSEELIGMNGLELIAGTWRDFVMKKIVNGIELSYDIKGLRKSGQEYHLRLQEKDIPYQGKSVRVAEFRDITETKCLEGQLIQSQKMEAIGTLAGGIAHDFNNILYPIVGYTELVMDDVPEESRAHENLQGIFNAAMRAQDLVKQILTFSRKGEMEHKPFMAQAAVVDALKLLRSSIPTTIEIKQKIDMNCGLITGDPTQIHQIVMNLCTNAYHAMEPSEGTLDVSLTGIELDIDDVNDKIDINPGKYLRLSVTDNGQGIPADKLGMIFEPYYTTKETGKGTGLGLSVIHGIVKNHNGGISVYSEPGIGTTFHIYLPVIEIDAKAGQAQSPLKIQTGNEHILLVDDEEPIVKMERQILQRLGYNVTTRTSSIEALEAFRAAPDNYDLIITDMTMPNMTGLKLAEKLIEIRKNIPIIICSGFSERINDENINSHGICSFVMKPIIKSDLAEKIRDVLDNLAEV